MSDLLAKLQSDLNGSRKAQDKPRTLLLSTIVSDVKNREIELKRSVSDDDVVEVLRRGIKKRRESVDMYGKAGRQELADKESAEVTVLETYLPAQVDPEEIRAAVRAALEGGAANVGAVMGQVMPRFKGRAEGNTINTIVREELAKRG